MATPGHKEPVRPSLTGGDNLTSFPDGSHNRSHWGPDSRLCLDRAGGRSGPGSLLGAITCWNSTSSSELTAPTPREWSVLGRGRQWAPCSARISA